jgi:hypothetical protein
MWFIRAIRAIRAKRLRKKQMRRETSHLTPHRSWISRLAFPPLGATGRRYWSDSAHQEGHFYQHWLQKRILRI